MVATYQSVSGAGKDGMDELDRQTKAIYSLQDVEPKKFPKRIAFNVIPHIDVFMEDGYTKEEWKMVVETKKILDPKIKLTATCVRVPVFIGHSEAVNIEFENPISVEEARQILRNAPGCIVIDKHEPGGYVTPLRVRRRGRDLHQPHPHRSDRRQRPGAVVRVRQSAQGRGAQRHPDRRSADQPQADQGEAEGGVGRSLFTSPRLRGEGARCLCCFRRYPSSYFSNFFRRMPSVRSRSALSRMKPSASFWS